MKHLLISGVNSSTVFIKIHHKNHQSQMFATCSKKKREVIVCDNLVVCGEKITETEHISSILNGLSPEYESVVAIITTSRQSYDVEAMSSILLDMENRKFSSHMSTQFSANMVHQIPT